MTTYCDKEVYDIGKESDKISEIANSCRQG